jgi:DNA-binding winged helix-turn-helix (wHTH) protein
MKVRKDEEYEFGSCRLKVDECRLWRGDEEIRLRPKLFDLLVIFVRSQARMLEKEELIQSLWPDSVVEDSNLTVTINALRSALNDQVYIETVSRRGYRFVPEVRAVRRDHSGTHRPLVIDDRNLIEPPGGALPLHSPLYISRPCDDEFCEAIARRDSIVLVKGARQVGKTSLLARGIESARRSRAEVLLIDFQYFSPAAFDSADTLLLAMAESIAQQVDLPSRSSENWNKRLSHGSNFERFLRREVLAHDETCCVLALDEVDRLFNYPCGSEIFALFRYLHNLRAFDPNGPWYRLTIAIAYATEAHLFISDLNQSLFNVGTRLTLGDLDEEQLSQLNERYGGPLVAVEINRFYNLLGGHPYLSQRGLYAIYKQKIDLPTLELSADRSDGPFADPLNRLVVSLQQDPELLDELRSFLVSGAELSHNAFYRLRSAGVVSGDTLHDARPRCNLYDRYLKKHL